MSRSFFRLTSMYSPNPTKIPFGVYFYRCTQRETLRCRHDGFIQNAMTVRNNAEGRFIKLLKVSSTNTIWIKSNLGKLMHLEKIAIAQRISNSISSLSNLFLCFTDIGLDFVKACSIKSIIASRRCSISKSSGSCCRSGRYHQQH